HVLLHPSPEQEQILWHICHGCWFLRALLVNERNDNRKENREQKLNGVAKPHYLNRADQYKAIPGYVAKYPDQLGGIHSQVLQNVAVRIDEGTKRWLEAGPGEQVRPPHHKRRRKYRSFTFPQYGAAVNLHHGELYASGIGKIPADCWRKLRGLPKTVTIKFKNGKWWAIITCAIQAKDIYKPMQAVAHLPDGSGDPGLETLLTDIEGTQYDPPRAWHDYRDQLAHELRQMSRKFRAREEQWKEDNIDWIAQGVEPKESLRKYPYSQRLQEQIRRVAKLYTKVSNIREYYHRKLAVIIDATFRLFGIEEHGLKFMIRNRRQAKSASDRAIGKMKKAVQSRIGLRYVQVPNKGPDGRGNSQVCVCGADVPKKLGDRVHECPVCGLKADRDHVAANVGNAHTFGFVSVSLSSSMQKAAGQAVRRGGSEVPAGASCGGELQCGVAAASEGPQPAAPKKRQSRVDSEDDRVWVRKLPDQAKPGDGAAARAAVPRKGAERHHRRRTHSRRAPKPVQCGTAAR
ncbi:MAG TPA: transposase, partial [Methylophilaceae bacterium]|nr:transposase [Methylophilaceae bacterium]